MLIELSAPPLEAIDIELDRRRCARSLVEFIKQGWHVVEPGQPYVHGWHIDAMAQHLEAVSYGHIIRLLMNVPPGTMKSLITAVFFPAWEWGPRGLAHTRFLGTSHSLPLAVRDNMKCRRLIQSEWYQKRWPLPLVGDQNAKTKFENDSTGFREAMAFTSMTGSRGDRVVIDDPLSVDDARSDKIREGVNETFRESLTSRLNNPGKSAIIVVMQRLHEDDVSGMILSEKLDYEHLMLPMEFDVDRRCRTSIGFVDPRTEQGELIFPQRFPRDVVERDKETMKEYAVAGQYQQLPVPREGGMFKYDWFEGKIIERCPDVKRWVRHWDLAATAKPGAARTAGVKMGRTPDGRYVIADVIITQSEGAKVREIITRTAHMDGRGVEISLPKDPGQAGKVQSQDMIAMLSGFKARAEAETGDKVTRAEPFASQCEVGNVYLVKGSWNRAYLDEICMFPGGKFKDQVDASSAAFARLATTFDPGRWTRAMGKR